MKINSSFAEGFLDGFSGIGLFMRLRRPGAPDELIDSTPLEGFVVNDGFARMINESDSARKKLLREIVRSVFGKHTNA